MLTGLYSAATAMESSAQRHDMVAHNLAHAHHPGFRRHVPVAGTFEKALNDAAGGSQSSAQTSSFGTASPDDIIDFTPGAYIQTGRTLDFAIQGDGFFVVDGPQGPLYTRNGVFHANSEGQLVTVDGLPVSGEGGPITIPKSASVGSVTVSADGRLHADGQEIGRLQVVSFEQQEKLESAGISLFQAPSDIQPIESEAFVIQGTHEGSNVSPVLEMVRMIDGMRQYDAAAKALQTIAEAVQQNLRQNS